MRRTRLFPLIAMLLAGSVLLSGCGLIKTRTVLIPPGEPVQLAEPVKAYVYVDIGGKRERSGNRVTLPEGWWCLPDPGR
ncbi:MAG: hypothetical protein WBF17_03655 [Phycisphaerae bacterium]